MYPTLRIAAVVTILGAAAPAPGQTEPITPDKVIPLFNGRDLAGLSTWLKDTKHEDPRKVFRVTDGLCRGRRGLVEVGAEQANGPEDDSSRAEVLRLRLH